MNPTSISVKEASFTRIDRAFISVYYNFWLIPLPLALYRFLIKMAQTHSAP